MQNVIIEIMFKAPVAGILLRDCRLIAGRRHHSISWGLYDRHDDFNAGTTFYRLYQARLDGQPADFTECKKLLNAAAINDRLFIDAVHPDTGEIIPELKIETLSIRTRTEDDSHTIWCDIVYANDPIYTRPFEHKAHTDADEIIIITPDRKVLKCHMSKELAEKNWSTQDLLNLFHVILDNRDKKTQHRLEKLITLPPRILESYGLEFEETGIQHIINLKGKQLLPYLLP